MPMIPTTPASSTGRAISIREALLVLALLLGWVAFVYRGAFGIGVLSDGWVLLAIGAEGFLKAPTVLIGYHSIPVTNLFMAALWRMFGMNPWAYQAVNLAEFGVVAWLLYLLGRELDLDRAVSLTASLLLVANVSFYEITLWPTVGNFQSLTAMLYLAGAFAALRLARGERPWLYGAAVAVATIAAFYTYEPAFSLLPVGLLAVPIFARQRGGPRAPAFPAILAALASAAAIAAGKLYAAAHGSAAAFLPTDWAALSQRAHYTARAMAGIFSLRGADPAMNRIVTAGLPAYYGTWRFQAVVGLWLLALAVGTVVLVRAARPALGWLALWFALQVATVSAATIIVSRHFYLAALPASLLESFGLWWVAGRLGDRFGRPGKRATAIQIVLVAAVFLALFLGSRSDLRVGVKLAMQATTTSQHVLAVAGGMVGTRPSGPAPPPRVTLVNMPAAIAQDGMGSFIFVNGLHEMVRLGTAGEIADLELRYTYDEYREGKFANVSRPMTLLQLRERVMAKGAITLFWDRARSDVYAASPADFATPTRYTASSAPYLDWRPGAWPWLRVYAGKPLEFPVALAPQGATWCAVRYLQDGKTRVRLASGSTHAPTAGPERSVGAPSWPAIVWPIASDASSAQASVSIGADSDVSLAGLWTFSAPPVYDPVSAPFLQWNTDRLPAFAVTAPIDLPLAIGPAGSRLRLEYLAAPGRELTITWNAESVELAAPAAATPEWKTVELPAGERVAVLGLSPHGTMASLVRGLAVVARP